MPDGFETLVEKLSESDLRLYKQQLRQKMKTMSPETVTAVLDRIKGIPQLSDILGPMPAAPTPVPTTAPAQWSRWGIRGLEPTPAERAETLPWLAKPLEKVAEVFPWLGMPIARPFIETPEMRAAERARIVPEFEKYAPPAFKEALEVMPSISPRGIEYFQPGGALRERYEQMPEWAQLLAELPALALIPTAAGLSVRLTAIISAGGKLAKPARVILATLKPAVAVEKGAAKAITYLPAKGVEAIAKKVAPKVAPTKVLEFPSTVELMEAVESHILPSWALKIPGARQLIGAIKFARVADDPIKAATVVAGQMGDMAEAGMTGALAKARLIQVPIKVEKNIVVDPLIKQIEKLPDGKMSMAIHDIVEYAPRYSMPENYRTFINEIREVSKDLSALLRKEKLLGPGMRIKPIKGETDFQYLHRVVVSVKEEGAKDLAVLIGDQLAVDGVKIMRAKGESAWEYLTRVMDDVTAGKFKPSKDMDNLVNQIADLVDVSTIRGRIDKPRFHQFVADGLKAGVEYADNPLFELSKQGDATYRLIIQKRIGEILEPLAVPKSALIAKEIGVTPAALRTNLQEARRLTAAIGRAKRGEKLPTVTLNALKLQFPKLGGKLTEAVTLPRAAGRMTKRREMLTELLPAAKDEIIKAQVALNKALRVGEQFPTVEMGQVIGIPGISGRIIPTQIIGGKKVLGRDISRSISERFGFVPPGQLERTMGKVGMVGGVMRMSKASLDLSSQLIQTALVGGLDFWNLMTSPLYYAGVKKLPIYGALHKPTFWWAKGVAYGPKAWISPIKAEAAYWNPENLWYLQESARLGALVQPAELVEYAGPVLQKLIKVPLVGKELAWTVRQTYGRAASAFTATRNITANEYRKGMWEMAEQMGKLGELARGSNLFTGVLSTRGMGIRAAQRNLESGIAFFSPRFTRAMGAVLGHILWHPTSWTGREALKAVTGLLAANYSFFTVANLLQGEKPPLDPRPESMGGDGARWLTKKIYGRYIGLGGMMSDIRAIVSVVSAAFDDPESLLAFDMTNPAFRRLRAKFAPPTAAFYDYSTGRDYIGRPVRGESLMPTKETVFELGKWGLPIWAESIIEEGWSLAGVLAEFFGGRTFPESNWNIYKSRLVELSDKDSIDDISPYERYKLEKQYPELMELKEVAQDEMERRGYNLVSSEYWNARDDYYEQRLEILFEADKRFRAGKISGTDLRKIIQSTGQDLGTKYKMLEEDARYAEVITDMEERAKERSEEALEKGWAIELAYQRYWDIRFDPELRDVFGEPNYEEIDRQLEALHKEFGEEVWTKLQDWVRQNQQRYPHSVRVYFEVSELLKPYWNITSQVWAQYPGLKEISDQIELLETTDPRRAKMTLFRYPQIVMARKMIALRKKQLKAQRPDIANALKVFYSY